MINRTKTLKGRKLQFQHDGRQTSILLFPFPMHWLWNIKCQTWSFVLEKSAQNTRIPNIWLPGMLDLRQQRTTKATGNAQCLHLQTLSLALALVQRSRCEHLFFLQLMGTHPRSSPFTPDTRLPNWDLNQLPNKNTKWLETQEWGHRNSNLIIYAPLVSQHIANVVPGPMPRTGFGGGDSEHCPLLWWYAVGADQARKLDIWWLIFQSQCIGNGKRRRLVCPPL